MDLLNHTINWYKGEIFESTMTGVFGVCLIMVSILFWKLGKTPNAQAVVVPLLVVGLILGVSGAVGAFSNTKKVDEIISNRAENLSEFVSLEKERVENFQTIYTYTKIGAGIFFAIAIVVFFIVENRYWQSVAIALIILGISGLVIDYFSKERADVYYEKILEAEVNTNQVEYKK